MGMKSRLKGSDEHKQKMARKEAERERMRQWVAANPRKPGQTIYVTPKVMNPKMESDAKIVATPMDVPAESFYSPTHMGMYYGQYMWRWYAVSNAWRTLG